jgi:N,N'-diacetyllegionaminate synthase
MNEGKLTFNTNIKIGTLNINAQSPIFIIAEAGVNHNGDMDLAFKMIDRAKEAGADAVKFQAFKTQELILESVEKAPYQKKSTAASESQFSMLKKLEVSVAQFSDLKKYCHDQNILFLVTPFDEVSLEELDSLNLEAYKVSSTDLTNLPFLKKIAQKKKPIILSTGMSYLEEVRLALKEILPFNKDVILLHCTANYPVQDNEVNLSVLGTLKETFEILTGYSDHTPGIGASPYAVPFGIKVLEKHFTLDKTMVGPDHKASLDIPELKKYIEEVRRVESYLGSPIKQPQESELATRASLQKSFVARKAIQKGEIFSEDNLVAKRCGGKGISPIKTHQVMGLPSPKNFDANEIVVI